MDYPTLKIIHLTGLGLTFMGLTGILALRAAAMTVGSGVSDPDADESPSRGRRSGRSVGGSDPDADEPLGHLNQHTVAGGITVSVVDQFETVQIETLTHGACDRLSEAVAEQLPVGQACQDIELCGVGELLVRAPALQAVA